MQRFSAAEFRTSWRKTHAAHQADRDTSGVTVAMTSTTAAAAGAVDATSSLIESNQSSPSLRCPFPDVPANSDKSVDALLWLIDRVKRTGRGQNRSATLVSSSDGGCVSFWSAIEGKMLGAFHAVSTRDMPRYVGTRLN